MTKRHAGIFAAKDAFDPDSFTTKCHDNSHAVLESCSWRARRNLAMVPAVTTSTKHKKWQPYLVKLAVFIHRHTIATLVVFSLITGVFGVLASRLQQKTTVRDLLPEDNRVVKNFEDTVDTFGLVDRVVIVVRFEKQHIELAEAFADILVDQSLRQPDFSKNLHWLKANLFDETEATSWHHYLQFLLRLMPAEQIPALTERLSDAGIKNQVTENRRNLMLVLESKSLIEKDPLNLLEFAGTYSKDITGSYQISFQDGFLVSADKDMLLILGKPTRSPEDVDYAMALDVFLKRQIDSAMQALAEEEGAAAVQQLKVGITGPHPIAAHENGIIRADVKSMFISSFVMVLLLFIIAYGRPLALLYVGIPLLSAEIWTLGIGYLLFGRLNLLTATFSAVIIGLGIDYAIHIFSRYLDERNSGHEALPALSVALAETGMGTFVGGLTTALAFLAMGVSNFSGLREFAAVAGIGILLCLFQMFTLLPALLFLRERFRRKPKHEHRAQWDFHLERILAWVTKVPRLSLVLFVLATLFLGTMATRLRFNPDLRSIRARSNPAIKLQNEVTAKVGGSLRSLTFVLEAESEEALYDLHDSLGPTLSRLKRQGDLVRYDSLLAVLQRPAKQSQNIHQLLEAGLTAKGIQASFQEAMDTNKMVISEESKLYIDNLAAGLEQTEPLHLREVLEDNPHFVRPFLAYREGTFKTLLHVYPAKGLWDKQATQSLTQQILEAAKRPAHADMFVTGIQTITDELKLLVHDSFELATILSFLLVVAVLVYHFRSLKLVALTLTPLVMAVIWMLGTMHLLGIDITLLNFVATPIVIGIGIDDGVHIVEKFLHNPRGDMCKLIASCGKAVTLTSLTTVFGFSSLFLAQYSGFQSLGLCAILGVSYCWLASVFLLPLLIPYFTKGFGEAPATPVT